MAFAFYQVLITNSERIMRIAYLSTCLPRECGIATFNDNLIRAIQINLGAKKIAADEMIVAVNDSDNRDEYEYPKNVKFIIRKEEQEDYQRAAEWINNSDTDVCVMQHEFGIYGGQSGLYILSLLDRLEKPQNVCRRLAGR